MAHRYLFEPLSLDPDVKTAQLLSLIAANPVLLEVLGRWDVQSLLREDFQWAYEDGDAAIAASTREEVPTLGALLDDLVSELSFIASPAAQVIAQVLSEQEWSEATVEELLGSALEGEKR